MIIYSSEAKRRIRDKPKSLLDSSGVQVGQSIEWGYENSAIDITKEERNNLLKCCRWKEIKTAKVLAVKKLMQTKTCSQIVRHYQGRNGWKKSTIKNIHRALSSKRWETHSPE